MEHFVIVTNHEHYRNVTYVKLKEGALDQAKEVTANNDLIYGTFGDKGIEKLISVNCYDQSFYKSYDELVDHALPNILVTALKECILLSDASFGITQFVVEHPTMNRGEILNAIKILNSVSYEGEMLKILQAL